MPDALDPTAILPEELVRRFVVRGAELDEIVRVLERTGRSMQHLLILGASGFGKSTLVRRVVVEIGARPALAGRWCPMVFSSGARGPTPFSPEGLYSAGRGVRESGRQVLLVVEDLDLLLGRLSRADAWGLRKVLQDDASTFLLLATAQGSFSEITDYHAPLYEGLRQLELRPLTAAEIDELWLSVAGYRLSPSRSEAIRVLTGGNPRRVVLLASEDPLR